MNSSKSINIQSCDTVEDSSITSNTHKDQKYDGKKTNKIEHSKRSNLKKEIIRKRVQQSGL